MLTLGSAEELADWNSHLRGSAMLSLGSAEGCPGREHPAVVTTCAFPFNSSRQ
ncbi:hypothetical protein J6590_090842 [Homalodisca vitripennis]|nr:hypothetical protein J6590_059129 [Homalodisca vitripennis]KAG8299858.1 hypothetical protein J6590_090842 [Homalodisca vitripennis]